MVVFGDLEVDGVLVYDDAINGPCFLEAILTFGQVVHDDLAVSIGDQVSFDYYADHSIVRCCDQVEDRAFQRLLVIVEGLGQLDAAAHLHVGEFERKLVIAYSRQTGFVVDDLDLACIVQLEGDCAWQGDIVVYTALF